MIFQLVSNFNPTGDQPQAICDLTNGVKKGLRYQTLLGVTGSGKTFTIANVIAKLNRPTLILSHNKTLAAQLYKEFKEFFPYNSVEYFISYYDFYQPEAYMPVSNKYIEKDFSINEEIEKMRLSTASSLLSGRRDVIVVSSVSCLYGMGNPKDYKAHIIFLRIGMEMLLTTFLEKLVSRMYSRNQVEFKSGQFRVIGDTVDVFIAYGHMALRIVFYGNIVEEMFFFDPKSGCIIKKIEEYILFPAGLFTFNSEQINIALCQIQKDLEDRIYFFKKTGKIQELNRLTEKVKLDLEMIKQLGYCSGIENYSRYFDGRKQGDRPFCLIDYFPIDFLMIIDESHVTIPQIRAMYIGDHSRKMTLVEYGFRLPAAIDNRPITFEEFESITHQKIFISATPSEYELQMCKGVVVEQVVRPTGLLDPVIEVRSTYLQIDDLMEEIRQRIEKNERILIITLTKDMAEELNTYFTNFNIRSMYIHSDIYTLDRMKILDKFRNGKFDVLIGVNLLREGLDLPEVSLVAVLDSDKEGFLRSYCSLTQMAGRAARNIHGKVIFYADRITESMNKTIKETNQRRQKQFVYNKKNYITPHSIVKEKPFLVDFNVLQEKTRNKNKTISIEELQTMNFIQVKKHISSVRKKMLSASKQYNYIEAAYYRDELLKLKKVLNVHITKKSIL